MDEFDEFEPTLLERMDYGSNIHVYPIDDILPHDIEGFGCWCQPEITQDGDSYLIVHNSADGREDYENDLY